MRNENFPDDSNENYALVCDSGDYVGKYVDEAAAELQKQLPNAKTRKIAGVIIDRLRHMVLGRIDQ